MLWRRRPQTEQVDKANPSMNLQNPQQIPQRGPIEGPYGQRLTRRVTWRSSTYKLVAYLYLLCVLYLLWLIRDLFFLPFSSTSTTSTSVTSSSTIDGTRLSTPTQWAREMRSWRLSSTTSRMPSSVILYGWDMLSFEAIIGDPNSK